MEMTDFDHWKTDEIVCPYCKYKFSASYEYFIYSDYYNQIDCENEDCEKKFDVFKDISVSYTSHRKEEETEANSL